MQHNAWHLPAGIADLIGDLMAWLNADKNNVGLASRPARRHFQIESILQFFRMMGHLVFGTFHNGHRTAPVRFNPPPTDQFRELIRSQAIGGMSFIGDADQKSVKAWHSRDQARPALQKVHVRLSYETSGLSVTRLVYSSTNSRIIRLGTGAR